jgi:lysophospholipase L1-like esterase
MPSLVRKLLKQLGLAVHLPPEPDSLPAEAWWQAAIAAQADSLQDQSLDFLWLGDSITAGLGTAGERETVRAVNAALSGMTTTSLVVQLQRLGQVNLRVRQGVIAIGTNDADRALTLAEFRHNLTTSIGLIQGLGAHRIHLLPAHFPTPGHLWHYGWPDALARVQQLNQILAQVADLVADPVGQTVAQAVADPVAQTVADPVAQTVADPVAQAVADPVAQAVADPVAQAVSSPPTGQPLVVYHPQFFASMYVGQTIEPSLTTDGVHLNEHGCQQYRELLWALMASSA